MRTVAVTLFMLFVSCARAEQGAGWSSYKDPTGFTLQLPRQWRAAAAGYSGRAVVEGSGGERLILWPVFIPGGIRESGAAAVLWRLLAQSGVKAQWSALHKIGDAAVRMIGGTSDSAAVAVFAWSSRPKGAFGTLYYLAAPRNNYAKTAPDIARILESFRVNGADASEAPAASFVWTRWHDPQEGAFSFEIPEGWRMNGGLFRFASVDTRPAWELTSPEGDIRIGGGDAKLPAFTEPNQLLAMSGFRDGAWYSPGYGVRMMVRRYTPGVAFAREYVSSHLAGCAPVQFIDNRERPDAVAALNDVYRQYGGVGLSVHLTAGDVSFTCNSQGRPMEGYYFAGTQRTQSTAMPGGIWNVEHLFGYLSPAGKRGKAEAVLRHILESVRINPQWAAMQQNIAGNTSLIVSRTQAEISRIISDTYWSRQVTLDELSRRRSNAALGVEDVVDPATGREFKVESGSNYYWIDQRGTVAGTQTDSRPNVDFRELVRLP